MKRDGKKLEIYIAAKLEPIYKYSRPTIGSGNTPIEKGDIKNPKCHSWTTLWRVSGLLFSNRG